MEKDRDHGVEKRNKIMGLMEGTRGGTQENGATDGGINDMGHGVGVINEGKY